MQNPATADFQRSYRLALLFILLLSIAAAFVQFFLTLEQRLSRQAKQLELKAVQLDQQLTPLLKLTEWLQLQALVDSTVEHPLSLILYNPSGQLLTDAESAPSISAAERQFLQANQAVFISSRLLYPWLERVVYLSDRGAIYLLPHQLSALQIQGLSPWLTAAAQAESKTAQVIKSEENKLLFSYPLRFANGETGRLLLLIDIKALLLPLQKVTPDADFLLLDESGQLLGGTLANGNSFDEHLLQLQRIGQQPLSLVMLEQRHGLLSEGVSGFLTYWLGYLLVLVIACMVFFYRYKQKVLQPLRRLVIHIERLTRDQGGVRHIPGGWEEIFDKISRLKP